jgi:putative SOS response-associated peptidase YedK
MPIVVPAGRINDWLTDEAPRVVNLIAPPPESALVATPVSKRVNSVRNDDPACVGPLEPSAERQGSLF